MITKKDFINEYWEYIGSLCTGEKTTRSEWETWIKKDCEDMYKYCEDYQPLTDTEINWIIDELAERGFVI